MIELKETIEMEPFCNIDVDLLWLGGYGGLLVL